MGKAYKQNPIHDLINCVEEQEKEETEEQKRIKELTKPDNRKYEYKPEAFRECIQKLDEIQNKKERSKEALLF